MKKISVVIPTYNEEENVEPLSMAIIDVFEKQLPQYDYEIIFADNHSKDSTRKILRRLCEQNRRIKAIFNARNFGQMRSPATAILSRNLPKRKIPCGCCILRFDLMKSTTKRTI